MAILEQRRTDRFIIRYDDGVPGAQTLAQDIGNFIEADFFRLRRYLPFDNDKSPDIFQSHPTIVTFVALTSAASLGIPVANLPAPGGGNNSGGVESDFQSGIMLINANGAGGGTISLDFARFIFIAEMSEQLMPAHGYVPGGDRVGASRGEALSRILAEEEQALCLPVAPDQTNGVDVKHQRRLAARRTGLRIKYPSLAEGQFNFVQPLGMLVQQIP